MARVLSGDDEPPFLHASAVKALRLRRESFAGAAHNGARKVEMGEDEVRWWTFAGGRVNSTLKYAIEALSPWKVVTDNQVLRVRGENSGGHDFAKLLDELGASDVWDDERLWANVKESLPEYRLSKFQDVLPEPAQREMLGEFMLDVPRARRIASPD